MSKCIVIDPGHGGTDPGAVGFGVREKDLAWKYSLSLKWFLQKLGYDVILTRWSDVYVPLGIRPQIARGKDAFVSIHFNAGSEQARGLEVWYHDNDRKGKKFAETVEGVMRKVTTSRGVKRDTSRYKRGFCVLRLCSAWGIPAILVEVGFITNYEENKALMRDNERLRLMQSLALAIDKFMKGG
ncbi:N-acetylmuramoyl-L-alanine amidase [bacterium]|nr:N-acetylmuramoyl-L-alanine amidase [bacterium]